MTVTLHITWPGLLCRAGITSVSVYSYVLDALFMVRKALTFYVQTFYDNKLF